MMGSSGPGFPNDSTLPLLAAFVLALAFLGGVVAVGLSDGADSPPAAYDDRHDPRLRGGAPRRG